MRTLLLALLFALSAQAAAAQSLPTVDDLSIIGLSDAGATVERRFNYPGMGGTGGFDNPDCLMLVTSTVPFEQPEGALTQLKDAINVFDGPAILFPTSGQRELNLLEGQILGEGVLVYYLKDLSKFVTGLRVASKGDETLKSVIERIGLGSTVGFQVVRGCRLISHPE